MNIQNKLNRYYKSQLKQIHVQSTFDDFISKIQTQEKISGRGLFRLCFNGVMALLLLVSIYFYVNADSSSRLSVKITKVLVSEQVENKLPRLNGIFKSITKKFRRNI